MICASSVGEKWLNTQESICLPCVKSKKKEARDGGKSPPAPCLPAPASALHQVYASAARDCSTSCANASGSLTAMSASTFRLTSMPAFLSPFMNEL